MQLFFVQISQDTQFDTVGEMMAQSRFNENKVKTVVSTKVKEPALSNESEKEESGEVNLSLS